MITLRDIKHTIACMMFITGCTTPQKVEGPAPKILSRWAAYYDDKIPAEHFKGYELVVFDRVYHPDLSALKGKGDVLAYVSAGEIHGDAPEFAELNEAGVLLKHNTHWNSHAVDLRSPRWQNIVLNHVADAKAQGFSGVMLDTLEIPTQVIRPIEKYDMQSAAANLIKTIRKQHPDMKIMVNRALEILPMVAKEIDFVLAESVCAQTDLAIGQSNLLPMAEYRKSVDKLQQLKAKAPQLKVYTLDYWNMDDVNGVHSIYRQQRDSGFIPYVSTPDLRKHTPEPLLGKTKQMHALNGDYHA